MQKTNILLVDSVLNFLIGVLLLIFPRGIIEFLGVPMVRDTFYPGILGAILIGIGIALFYEWSKKKSDITGLGTGGAIIINACVGLALMSWLLFGDLDIPARGHIILWCLVLIIFVIITVEVIKVKKS
jgi:hypothetical protein